MSRNNLVRPIVRCPITRRAGMPRGPGGLDEVILDVSPGAGGVSSSDPWGWPDDYYAYRVFDWRGTDGTTPLVGAPIGLFGGSVSAKATPFSYSSGAIQAGCFPSTPNTYYRGLYKITPNATTDMVVCLLLLNKTVSRDSYYLHASSGTPSKGIILRYANSSVANRLTTYGDTTVSLNLASQHSAWTFWIIVFSRSANMIYWYNSGILGSSTGAPTGTYESTDLFYIGATTNSLFGCIARLQVFLGAGIASSFSSDYVKYYSSAIFGLKPKNNKTYSSFTRTGSLATTVASNTFLVEGNVPRINRTQGLSLSPTLTNKCYRNYALVSGDESYITISGGMTKTTQSVNLEAYNLYGISELVYEVTNATGSDGYVTSGATVATLASRSVSVRAHHQAGSGCILGLYDSGTLTWTSGVAVSDNYVRSHAVVTPGHINQQWAIKIPTGCTIRFVLQCNTLSPIYVPEIPNFATAAAAVVGVSSINWGVNLTNEKSVVQAEIAPDGWSGNADAAARTILSDSVSAGQHMVADAVNQQIAISDGTNSAAQAISEVDSVYQTVYTGWGPAGIVAEVASVQNRNSYDGAIGAGYAITDGINRWLRSLKIVRKQR